MGPMRPPVEAGIDREGGVRGEGRPGGGGGVLRAGDGPDGVLRAGDGPDGVVHAGGGPDCVVHAGGGPDGSCVIQAHAGDDPDGLAHSGGGLDGIVRTVISVTRFFRKNCIKRQKKLRQIRYFQKKVISF